jgi:hypothetical protein
MPVQCRARTRRQYGADDGRAEFAKSENRTEVAANISFLSGICTPDAENSHRAQYRAFTRGGPFDVATLVAFLLYMTADAGRRGYALLLEAFWDDARGHGVPTPDAPPRSAAAVCGARAKLAPAFLRALVHRTWEAFEDRFRRRRTRRVYAVDGSKFNLPRSAALDRKFGRPACGHVPQMTLSTLFDLDSLMPRDALVDRYSAHERALLLQHCELVRPGDVVVADRGYPSFEVFQRLGARGVDFVMRIHSRKTFPAVEAFAQSGAAEAELVLAPPRDGPLNRSAPIAVRAVRVERADEPWLLLTSLRKASAASVADLYRRRWEIEEFYREAKAEGSGPRVFHARSESGVRQEAFALALYFGLTRYLAAAAAEAHDAGTAVPPDDSEFADQPHDEGSGPAPRDVRDVAEAHADRAAGAAPKGALFAVGDYLVRLLLHGDGARLADHLAALFERLRRRKPPRRSGRSCPRVSYKPHLRWNASGRCRG